MHATNDITTPMTLYILVSKITSGLFRDQDIVEANSRSKTKINNLEADNFLYMSSTFINMIIIMSLHSEVLHLVARNRNCV